MTAIAPSEKLAEERRLPVVASTLREQPVPHRVHDRVGKSLHHVGDGRAELPNRLCVGSGLVGVIAGVAQNHRAQMVPDPSGA